MTDTDNKQLDKLLLDIKIKGKKLKDRGDCGVCGELLQKQDTCIGICNCCYTKQRRKELSEKRSTDPRKYIWELYND